MKKIMMMLLVLFALTSCEQATIDVPSVEVPVVTVPETPENPTTETIRPYYVKNSVWKNVDLSAISTARAVIPSLDQALDIVKTYNAENNDNQLFLNTVDIPLEEAPTVDVYIVNEGDYVVLAQWIGLDRVDFTTRYADFKSDERVFGGILFVDKIPPIPIPKVDTRTRHEKYHIQMVNKYDKIVVYNGFRYEESCEETWDSFNGTGPSIGYPTVDDYFASRVSGYETEIRGVGLVPEDAPWRVVSGQIYTEPVE